MTTLRRFSLSRNSIALTKLLVNFHPEDQEILSKTTESGSTELVLTPRYKKTPIAALCKFKKIFPKLVCFTLLALLVDQGFAQEPTPGEEKTKTSILDKILKKAGVIVDTTAPEPLPKDFEKKAKREYEQIEDPDISYPRYLETRKQEYWRLSQLKKNPQLSYIPAIGHKTPCGSGDFEAGLNPAEWQGAYGSVPSNGNPVFSSFTNGIVSGAINSSASRQTIVGPGTDPTVGIPLTAPGGSARAIRIGNAVNGAGSELLSKTFIVTPAESLLSFWYAAVFEDPNHPLAQQPSFWVRITDTGTGVEIPNLVNLGNGSSKLVADGNNPFFQKKPGSILYKDWTCAQINLSQMIGKTVTIEFVTEDCTQNGHYAYAYIDNFCGNCSGSPTGSVSFSSQGSSNCGPGTICFDYTLPKNPSTAATGNVKISLDIYQNGTLLTTLISPTLTSGTSYCFPVTPLTIPGIAAGLGGFDFVATGVFALAGTPASSMAVGTAPAGRLAGLNNDYQIVCSTPTASKWCCPGSNLVTNGDFEAGNTGFSSGHTFNPAVAPAFVTAPGQYNVVNSAGALAISPNWNVTDHAVCNGFPGSKFMVVNGKTTQPVGSSRVLWQQTVTVTKDREYRFCANVKNLIQSTFDMKPRIWVQFISPNGLISTVTVNEATGPCNWRSISSSFNAPATSAMTIKIWIDEARPGDGNDLALDDISLQVKPQVVSNLVGVNYATTDIGGGQYNVSATPTALPPGYSYGWLVGEWDPITNGFVGFTNLVINPPSWQTSPLPNTFIGYNGLNGTLTGTAPGKFSNGKVYRVLYAVWSDCEAQRVSSFMFQYNKMLQKPQVTSLPLRQQDLKLLQKYLPQTAGDQKQGVAELSDGENSIDDLVAPNENEASKLPRAEDDVSSEIAVARPTIEIGQPAPDFKMEDADGEIWRLSDLRNKKNVLLTFFPKCFTGGCANHLSSLRDRQDEFDAADTQIIAVSVDPAAGEQGQRAFAKRWQLMFPLMPDTERRLSKLFGAVENDRQLAARMSVLIDKQGIVRFVDTNVNVMNHGADMIALMRELGVGR